MENVEYLLTDEYVEFSQKVAAIHAEKKTLKEAFKKQYEEFQLKVKELDDGAKEAIATWEQWKLEKAKEEEEEE
jgi:hypothetical protein